VLLDVVHFGHLYEEWSELTHGTTCIWTYRYAYILGKPKTV